MMTKRWTVLEILKAIENNAMRFAANSDKEKKKEIG